MSRASASTGLEGAPDIMLLTMAALMVAIVWLVAHAHERTLPPIDLPEAEAARLGTRVAGSVALTLRPTAEGRVEAYLDERRVPGDLDGLEPALAALAASELVLRADANTLWQDSLSAMNVAARLGVPVAVAGEP